ncbi:hypothetical protein FAP39_04510 [Shimia litoralis]|uniref:Lipoprotein n=1 Tax=Shimia litoralis TaxID=420403 RepID=A0A4U7N863_9RHOB|nr:hypothetical protein [Shimia litoralis]TKZ21867.1 hypothetical protein FAP39_04510 [Shimia litoralis]
MRYFKLTAFALCATATLSACGDNFGEQALFGGAAGAVTAEVFGGNAGTGALVGSAANVLFCKENPGKCS